MPVLLSHWNSSDVLITYGPLSNTFIFVNISVSAFFYECVLINHWDYSWSKSG